MDSNRSAKNNLVSKCSVKNCGRTLQSGEGVYIHGELYCSECAAQILTQTLNPNLEE